MGARLATFFSTVSCVLCLATGTAHALVYSIDDGPYGSTANTVGNDVLGMNPFTAVPGATTIRALSVAGTTSPFLQP